MIFFQLVMSALIKSYLSIKRMSCIQTYGSNIMNKAFQIPKLKINKFVMPFVFASGYLYFAHSHRVKCSQVNSQVQQFQKRRDNMKLQTVMESKKSLLSTLWSFFCHTLRLFQLILIFSPVILLFPFRKFKFLRDFWLGLFVRAVERAGVVWIKAFQYMSHRRDLIGFDMADKFVHLREHAPQHSFQQTKKNFEKNYGKKISEVFQQFDAKPIASGSVSQVYKAIYKGNKVAVKVRHPGVQKYIQRDINILFFISNFLSLFSRAFNLPVSEISMKKTLIDQIDFNHEKENLLIFNQMFKNNKSVKFPFPFSENTNQSFLVESFVEGVPITHYERNPHHLNAVIARLGAMTFFEMLIKNNFIHADCHGGNIIVEIQQRSYNFFTEIYDYVKQRISKFQQYLTFESINSDVLKKLFKQTKKQEDQVKKVLKGCKEKVVLTLIDVGMVIRLDQRDRMNFITFLKSVCHGDGQNCAEMIYNLSIFDGKKIIQGKFKKYMSELRNLFSQLDGQPLENLRAVELLVGMLNIIRENNMKLQGQFATLLTNMLVLQAMAKDLNPNINILKCAVPYFKYAQNPVQFPVLPQKQTI